MRFEIAMAFLPFGLTAGCHAGDLVGEGAVCDLERPCRDPLTCQEGMCKVPAVAVKYACTPAQRFGEPRLVQELAGATGDDWGARLSADEKNIVFGSNRDDGEMNIYAAGRSSVTDPFDLPRRVFSPPMAANDYEPTVSADGLTMYFELNTGNSYTIQSARRSTVYVPFGVPQEVSLVSSNVSYGVGDPYLLSEEGVLYFQSADVAPPSSNNIYRFVLDGSAGPPQPVPGEINTMGYEVAPVVSHDQRTLYFSGVRTVDGLGETDIWVSTRADAAASFGPPVNVAELNTAAEEGPSWISDDMCRLYFYRHDSDGMRIYVAERSPQPL